jgi:hypothetical protein
VRGAPQYSDAEHEVSIDVLVDLDCKHFGLLLWFQANGDLATWVPTPAAAAAGIVLIFGRIRERCGEASKSRPKLYSDLSPPKG